MKYLDGVLVVEGSNDASYISSFIDTEIVTLNGFELLNLDYLKAISKVKKVYVLTDPDKSGLEIRERINKEISRINIEVDITKCNKNNKHGVAECLKDEILEKLGKYLGNLKEITENQLNIKDVMSLENKDEIKAKYHLGKCNTKKMVERLNSLGITKEELYGN